MSNVIRYWERFVAASLNIPRDNMGHLPKVVRNQFMEVLFRGFKMNSGNGGGFYGWYNAEFKSILGGDDNAGSQEGDDNFSMGPQITYEALSTAMNSVMFVTNIGSIGIVSNNCNIDVGDTVHLLLGGNTPYVLRQDVGVEPCDGKSVETPPNSAMSTNLDLPYILKGPCYVQGYMDGEAMPAFRRGEIEFSRITLR
ncbi:hypothetical protein ONS95_000288 [Cadophora gregata]|uniref:uncharacterized protein n=1 Tax=Cadophora gregata TaxID=51156 RepID=UPI0026DCEA89|nr:uncharacterized protein ONS95_000288 [Cadophora gregata]KAK0125710.1 hypothetical protein ONS96_009542 [Cadophora gregata f. sp. sojae]KAK0128313.1 hypothetical protein ONS95_000288 [Cadophora gregata]